MNSLNKKKINEIAEIGRDICMMAQVLFLLLMIFTSLAIITNLFWISGAIYWFWVIVWVTSL